MTRDEFSAKITAMTKTLYRVSYGLLRCEADREDAVQETILRAWEKLPTLKNEAYFQTWAVRILINACRDIGRQRSRVIPIDALRETEAAPPPDAETRALRDAVLALPEALRLPVVLHYVEGYGVAEVGAILDLPAGTVKSRLYRARDLLRNELKEAENL